MTRDEALALLPTSYAQALRLRSQGCDEMRIAEELAIEPAAVRTLLHLAQAKLTRLLTTDIDDSPA